ncbi:SapC family protein [Altererythrobacter arenosus]|uniref:SapC family protein n=1 Tax=Altererythrobacter arenosus TaxID=3032592 RepID=A0ABY8FPF4_9SPHN|nr:SapC family protein [Altererythrobacter sp. CAU 1644]WFL76742.1 SapC family protein [Altererythrobacter sp. CAU 1644]
MASAPQPQLPLFYKDLMPLNSRDHAGWKSKAFDDIEFFASTHAIPLTVDEFVDAQRNYPIVFTANDNPLPIALFGLNEGVNTFIKEDGKLEDNVYLPAYVRRYPFILARLNQESEDLSLCFDPSAGVVGEFDQGNDLFTGEGQASEFTNSILEFCRRFEESGHRTRNLIEQLVKHDLLMDGEIAITRNDNPDRPFVYRGFKMVDEQKLRDLPTEVLEEMSKNGMLMIIHAHLFSLNLMRIIFARQSAQGKVPEPVMAEPTT